VAPSVSTNQAAPKLMLSANLKPVLMTHPWDLWSRANSKTHPLPIACLTATPILIA